MCEYFCQICGYTWESSMVRYCPRCHNEDWWYLKESKSRNIQKRKREEYEKKLVLDKIR